MRRFTKYLILAAGIAACDSATEAVAPESAGNSPSFAAAGSPVNPGTLIPVPPEGAVFRADGRWIICHTSLSFAPVNEPAIDLPCGTVYETGTDERRGIRWYDSEGRLAERFVSSRRRAPDPELDLGTLSPAEQPGWWRLPSRRTAHRSNTHWRYNIWPNGLRQ